MDTEHTDSMNSSNYYPALSSQMTNGGCYNNQGYPMATGCYSDESGEEGSVANYPIYQQQQQQQSQPHHELSHLQQLQMQQFRPQQQFQQQQHQELDRQQQPQQQPQQNSPSLLYCDTPFQPPSTSYYSSNYYPSTSAIEPSQSYPSSIGQVPWYQPPIAAQQDQMMNMLHFSNSNGREARNRAEKNRRDKLNGSIQELSTMVPHVAESPRRVDKTAVLRFSAHGLRVRYVFGKALNSPPKAKPQITDSLMKLLDSFLLTITCRGQIVLVSPSVEQHLGHCQTDLFGQNILHITHPDDHALLKKEIIPKDLETLFDIQPEDENGEQRSRTQEEEDEIDCRLREDKRNFTLRLARAGPRSEPTTYEIVKIDGCFRRADSAPRGVKASTFPSGLQLIRRARGRDDSVPLHTISGNDIVLVAMARIIKPPKICTRILEGSQFEYRTRHLIDGRIIQCDQRISLVAGYMTDEVNGLSPFTFMHQDDVRWVIVALRQMYDCNSAYGESCYRLLTRTGKFIYLRTRGYLEIDKSTNKVHSFVCINTLVNDDEGRQRVRDMKNKFSIIINTKIPQSAVDAPAADNPSQLERAIIYLIENLQKSDQTDEDGESHETDSSSYPNHRLQSGRLTKSPPLAIIPPKPCTIKPSITRSITVVNCTAAKYLQKSRSIKLSGSPQGEDSEENSRESYNTDENQSRPSVLHKSDSYSTDSNGFDGCETRVRETVVQKDGSFNLLKVKQEVDYDEPPSRVPKLPTSRGYFDEVDYNPNSDHNQTRHLSSPGSFIQDTVSSPSGNYGYSEPNSNYRHTSVLKRNIFPDKFGDPETVGSIPKRRMMSLEDENFIASSIHELTDPETDLTHVLPSSFEAIDRSLTNIENAASELKGQCSTYAVDPSSQHQLDEIMEEHQEQRQMLQNIQHEFQAHIQGADVAVGVDVGVGVSVGVGVGLGLDSSLSESATSICNRSDSVKGVGAGGGGTGSSMDSVNNRGAPDFREGTSFHLNKTQLKPR